MLYKVSATVDKIGDLLKPYAGKWVFYKDDKQCVRLSLITSQGVLEPRCVWTYADLKNFDIYKSDRPLFSYKQGTLEVLVFDNPADITTDTGISQDLLQQMINVYQNRKYK